MHRRQKFPRILRLVRAVHYHRTFNQGIRFNRKYLILVMATNELSYARLGLAIPKRNVAKAYERNRVKRLIRESFRVRKNLPKADFVFMARFGIERISNAELLRQINELWRQAQELS